jgi:hypothetical protein
MLNSFLHLEIGFKQQKIDFNMLNLFLHLEIGFKQQKIMIPVNLYHQIPVKKTIS